MPLSFSGVYKLSDVNNSYVRASQIAMAPRVLKAKNREEFQFLVANDVNFGHTISGKIKTDDKDRFDVEDSDRRGDDGKPVLWRFEPLTLELWNEMGENNEIGGWKELKESIQSDADLLQFYRQEWIAPSLDWWSEDSTEHSEPPKEPEAKEKPKTKESEAPEAAE